MKKLLLFSLFLIGCKPYYIGSTGLEKSTQIVKLIEPTDDSHLEDLIVIYNVPQEKVIFARQCEWLHKWHKPAHLWGFEEDWFSKYKITELYKTEVGNEVFFSEKEPRRSGGAVEIFDIYWKRVIFYNTPTKTTLVNCTFQIVDEEMKQKWDEWWKENHNYLVQSSKHWGE